MIKNPLSDTKPDTEKMMGFFRGVVEDNNDPEKAGRVRVRIFGIHTSQLRKTVDEGIPVDELPWAEPCLPIVEGSISGFGIWGIPLQGSHVMLFFESNNLAQPRYFASMPGIPESKFSLEADSDEREDQLQAVGYDSSSGDFSKGFRDPDLVYPLNDRLGEPDVDRLARGVTEDTPVEFKNDNRTTGVSEAGGGTWDEPESPYAAQYPNNTVLQTHGGTLIELDSTSGEERIHLYHPSKSYIEIDANGVMVIKNTNKKYEIVVDDKNINIQGNNSETINGDDKLKVEGDSTTEIDGDETRDITGDVDETIGGNETREIGGNIDETVQGNRDGHIVGGGNVQVDGVLNITVTGLVTITGNSGVIVTGGNVTVNSAAGLPAGSVQLGSQGTTYMLMDERLIPFYNVHTHAGGGGGIPVAQLAVGVANTSNVEAS